ncbi:hypothetical protein DFH09DRAFT_1288188, partial [Mycena vulgaris]
MLGLVCHSYSYHPPPTDHALFRSTRTDQLIRMGAAKNGVDNSRRLIPCQECNLTFCCLLVHWEVARALHRGPCKEALDGLFKCEMNSKIHAHIKFKAVMESAHGPFGRFKWSPRRVKSVWMSLSGLSWEAEFDDEIHMSVGGPTSMAPWILEVSDNLSMASTVLYGLETLNDDDGGHGNIHLGFTLVFSSAFGCVE